jgi:hypothetical protein
MLAALSKPKFLRTVGITFFVLSFVTPSWSFGNIGLAAFIDVPQIVWWKFSEGDVFHDWQMIVFIGSLSIGWLSNFTVFFSLPRPAAVTAMASPWILFLAMIFLSNSSPPDLKVVGFIPFYPWAFGIGMIQISRLIERCGITAPVARLGASD